MYTVSFNTEGGDIVPSQSIEEGSIATEPNTPSRDGYTFVGWEYDFASLINKNTEITANWKANTDTKYTVEYYLQNLAGDGYDLVESVELTGTTDTIATAGQKLFEHFTSKGEVRGNINGNGSLVLKAYYTRDSYTVTINVNNTIYGSATTKSYPYGTEANLTVTTYLGRTFLGWYDGETLLSTDSSYSVVVIQDLTLDAVLETSQEMEAFEFVSTTSTCKITGIKDKNVTSIVVPEYVTNIDEAAFFGCSTVESITLPFIGGYNSATSASKSTLFGYIFGSTHYSGGVPTEQYYSPLYDTARIIYYIPSSLKSVTITGGIILDGALVNCTGLTDVTIGNGVMNIGSFAFKKCTSLTSVTIGNGVRSIGSFAFLECGGLNSVTIGDGVVSIGTQAFRDCYRLSSVKIPDSVTTIGSEAFRSCGSLISVIIGNGVTSIGGCAFEYCRSLTSVTIGTGVTHIAGYAFSNCTGLTSIMYRGTEAQWIDIVKDFYWNTNTGSYTITYNYKGD